MSANQLIATPVIEPGIDVSEGMGENMPKPTLEQMHTSDRVFEQHDERSAALNVLGIVATAQLLHDLALEHFVGPRATDEEEETRRKARPQL